MKIISREKQLEEMVKLLSSNLDETLRFSQIHYFRFGKYKNHYVHTVRLLAKARKMVYGPV